MNEGRMGGTVDINQIGRYTTYNCPIHGQFMPGPCECWADGVLRLRKIGALRTITSRWW